jgi:hypothetical protein
MGMMDRMVIVVKKQKRKDTTVFDNDTTAPWMIMDTMFQIGANFQDSHR